MKYLKWAVGTVVFLGTAYGTFQIVLKLLLKRNMLEMDLPPEFLDDNGPSVTFIAFRLPDWMRKFKQ